MLMKPHFSLCLAAGALALLAAVVVPLRSSGQAAAPLGDADPAALIAELDAQHALLAANQTRIDEKLGVIAEDVRQARLFASRAGGPAKTKP